MAPVADPLRFTRWVADDIHQALARYDAKSVNLGNRFRDAVESGFDLVERNPDLFPFAFADLNVRFYRLRRFPYLILYQARPTTVLIVGVVHAASDPERMRRRIAE
jgi:plasmid stabilization system protein ParE